MKSQFTLGAVLILASLGAAQAQGPTASAPNKIPHSHASHAGGSVLMFGDDHVEVIYQGKKIVLELSDKVREKVKLDDVDLAVALVEGEKKTPLTPVADAKKPYRVAVELPTGSQTGELEIRMKRKEAPRGYITSDRPQTINIGNLKASAAGAGHP